jgi:hypothetical protein
MRKTILTSFATIAALGTGAALADEPWRVEASAPVAIAELTGDSAATVAGTVLGVARRHFTIADMDDRTFTVDARRLGLRDLAPGQLITVTGRVDDGELKAQQVIREDGTVVLPKRNRFDRERNRDSWQMSDDLGQEQLSLRQRERHGRHDGQHLRSGS